MKQHDQNDRYQTEDGYDIWVVEVLKSLDEDHILRPVYVRAVYAVTREPRFEGSIVEFEAVMERDDWRYLKNAEPPFPQDTR